MNILRTPDERFNDLPGFAYEPRYVNVADGLRMHYVEAGPPGAPVVLLLHGEPTWSYLYRKMIPLIAAGNCRAVAPDLVGFGRSDKPAGRTDYTYERHLVWLRSFVDAVGLTDIILFCQDWGGLLGLRMVAEQPERFSAVVAANTFLPTGDQPLGEAFFKWREYSQRVEVFPIGATVRRGCAADLPDEVMAAYDAPFPDESYKSGARQFPMLVPATPDDPAAPANRAAWEVLARWDKPFLTVFGDSDPITRGAETIFQAVVPGARGRQHPIVKDAGHFLQEDKGEEIAGIVLDFVSGTF